MTTLAILATIVATTTTAASVQARPLFAGPGYDDGYEEGKNDFLVGNSKGYDCSPNNSDDYCDSYRDGYGDGWSKQEDLGRQLGSFENDN